MDVASAPRPASALCQLVQTHAAHSDIHPEMFGLLITELGHLPVEERRTALRAQHDYIREWDTPADAGPT